jgi:DNA-binding MarR family transcriptional regulator
VADKLALTPSQVAALRALGERDLEASPSEVAVSGLLLPNQASSALKALEAQGLVKSTVADTNRSKEQSFALSAEGRKVCRALAQVKGAPPVGTVVRLSRPFAVFSKAKQPSSVEIVADD